jgi:hypothetical protein
VNLKFKVTYGDITETFDTLDLAMNYAKTLDKFVTISGDSFEVVGLFGVDSVVDGKCPDGVAYDWNKASRIGAPKRVRV